MSARANITFFSTVVVVMFIVYRHGYFLHTQLYEVEFVFRPNEKFRRFLFIQVGKVSKLFKNENIHLEKFWPHYDIDNTILLRKIGSNTLTLEGPWKVTRVSIQNIAKYPVHKMSCETNSVVKYKNYWSHGSKILDINMATENVTPLPWGMHSSVTVSHSSIKQPSCNVLSLLLDPTVHIVHSVHWASIASIFDHK